MGSNWLLRQGCDRFFCLDPNVGRDSTVPRRFQSVMRPARVDPDIARSLSKKRHPTPIARHTDFLFRARQFAPVNTAPEKPWDKSGKIHAKDPRHTSTATELSKRFEFEWFLRFAIDTRDDVMRENFTFA